MASDARTRRKPGKAQTLSPPVVASAAIWWRLALIALAGAIVYSNSLGNPFVFDDHATLADNPYIRSFSTFWHTDKGSALTGRPIVAWTFAVNYAIGGPDVFGYRIVNIGLHILCGLLLFGLANRTTALPAVRDRLGAAGPNIALAIALIWTVHPLNTEVVDYLTQRTESMMALGYFLTMYAALREGTAVRGRALGQAIAVVACASGMLCKESMATAPAMVVLFDRAFLFPSFADAVRRRWRLYAALAATWVVVIYSVTTASRELSGGYATTHVSAWSYLLNQTEVIAHYLQLVVWPQALVAYYGWSLPTTLSAVLPYAVLITAAVVASLIAYVRWPRIGYLPLWFFLTLAPTSSILPVAAEVGADRRMYVPLAGLVALAVLAGWKLIRPRAVAIAVTAAVVLALGARTLARNADYATELRLSETTLAAWPSAVAHDMVGLSLAQLGRTEESVRELRQAVADYPPAGYDLGAQLFKLGRLDEAVEVLQRFVAAEPGMFTTSTAHTLMGRAFISQRRPADAMRELDLALKGPAPDPQAHALLAELLMDQQQFPAAIDHYRAYLGTAPADGQAWGNLGIALASANRPADAVAAFQRAADLQPSNNNAHENLARMLLETGQGPAAEAAARRALGLAPGSAAAYDLLGQAFVIQQRLPEARQAFERALQIDPGFAEARDHLRRVAK